MRIKGSETSFSLLVGFSQLELLALDFSPRLIFGKGIDITGVRVTLI